MERFFKILVIFICAVTGTLAVHAQDKLCTTTGEIIDVTVTRVSPKSILYKDAAGSLCRIMKKEVNYIIYQNGTKDNFYLEDVLNDGKKSTRRQARLEKHGIRQQRRWAYDQDFGRNIFSLVPAYTQSWDHTINDGGMGVGYEHLFGRRGRISINAPVIICVSSAKDYTNSVVQNGGGSQFTYNGYLSDFIGTYPSCYIMPGVKYYFSPALCKVRYSLGVSLFAILGEEPIIVNDFTNLTGTSDPAAIHQYTMYGFMLSNSLTVRVSPHLLLSLDLAVGLPETDDRYFNYYSETNEKVLSTFIQTGLKIGYLY